MNVKYANTNMNVQIHKKTNIQIHKCRKRISEGQYGGLSALKHHQSVSVLLAIPSFTIHCILITDDDDDK